MLRRLNIFHLSIVLPLLLSGCGLYDWANQHMPVIGDRCENWQCFTQSGQEQSKLKQQQQQNAVQQPNSPSTTIPAAPDATTPPAPPAASLPDEPATGAYKYVPRKPAPPGTTPFDGPVQ